MIDVGGLSGGCACFVYPEVNAGKMLRQALAAGRATGACLGVSVASMRSASRCLFDDHAALCKSRLGGAGVGEWI